MKKTTAALLCLFSSASAHADATGDANAFVAQVRTALSADLMGFDRDGRIDQSIAGVLALPAYRRIQELGAQYEAARAATPVNFEALRGLWGQIHATYDELQSTLPQRGTVLCPAGHTGSVREGALTVGGRTVDGTFAVCTSDETGALADYAVKVSSAFVGNTSGRRGDDWGDDETNTAESRPEQGWSPLLSFSTEGMFPGIGLPMPSAITYIESFDLQLVYEVQLAAHVGTPYTVLLMVGSSLYDGEMAPHVAGRDTPANANRTLSFDLNPTDDGGCFAYDPTASAVTAAPGEAFDLEALAGGIARLISPNDSRH